MQQIPIHSTPNFACDGQLSIGIKRQTLGLVNLPNDAPLSNVNQSQAKFESAVGGNLLQSWVNLTIVNFPGQLHHLNKFILLTKIRHNLTLSLFLLQEKGMNVLPKECILEEMMNNTYKVT